MKILHRYLVKNFVKSLFFCLFLFFMMFIFVDSLNNLDEFVKNKMPAAAILGYYASLLPLILSQILPAAALLASLHFLSNLNRHNEIAALKASGVSSARILAPFLMLGLVLSFAVLAVNETIVPRAAASTAAVKKGLLEQDGGDASDNLKNVTLLAKGNCMMYARELDLDTGTLHEVIVMEHNPNLSVKARTTAARGVYEDGRWFFYDGVRYELDQQGDTTGKPEIFDKRDSGIEEGPIEFIRQGTETQFMNYKQLKEYVRNTQLAGRKTSDRLSVELHQKLAAPFVSFVILLVGAPAAMRIRKGGALLSMTIGICIVAVYYVAIAVSSALGKGGALPPLCAVWLPHFAFACTGIFLIRKYA